MTIRILLAAIALCVSAAAAQADDPHPWDKDQALLKELDGALQSDGIMGVAPRVDRIEQALKAPQLTLKDGDTLYILTDGPAEALIAMAMVSGKKPDQPHHAVAVDNPYPMLALYLGSYYDEIGKPQEAVRVLEAGLKATAISGVDLAAHRPILLGERGAALASMKRWSDALTSYDEGLKAGDIDTSEHALLLRGRGFALTELNRLDDAQDAYEQSLKLDPGNPRAQHELDYIAGLRKGAMPLPSDGKLVPIQPQGVPPPPDAPAH